ncbi:MAG: 16S rRNA (cytosine(1402)-N(4))-methyltransferase RsmH [Proteobacteria bacterium]|nr:16S rRNA (cytosine(1402)-N(4))-methyltransferase RsmH [Pseudomonadota bacterium]NCA28485.1 16S rRNA (cytosine(1402)-N(4))-methyltransferase RsmH [Pseudomonadota bacterium]
MTNHQFHKPVMLNEVIENLAIKDGEVYIDATFGAGGYSSAILEKAECKLIAFDRDISVKKFAEDLHKKFGDRFVFKNQKFSEIAESIKQENIHEVDAIVFDIGVSSMQLDEKIRGFSFDAQEKLDMRMDQSQKMSAFDVVNYEGEEELANIIFKYGEEPKARKIAKKIVLDRKIKPIITCVELAQIVRSFYRGYHKTDPATKTFQAIRIFVNRELEELKLALNATLKILKKDGRLVVVSFHSLEDKIVKDFFREQAGLKNSYSRYQPDEIIDKNFKRNFQIITKSAVSPSQFEIDINPRSRSAKMRVAHKL